MIDFFLLIFSLLIKPKKTLMSYRRMKEGLYSKKYTRMTSGIHSRNASMLQ